MIRFKHISKTIIITSFLNAISHQLATVQKCHDRLHRTQNHYLYDDHHQHRQINGLWQWTFSSIQIKFKTVYQQIAQFRLHSTNIQPPRMYPGYLLSFIFLLPKLISMHGILRILFLSHCPTFSKCSRIPNLQKQLKYMLVRTLILGSSPIRRSHLFCLFSYHYGHYSLFLP